MYYIFLLSLLAGLIEGVGILLLIPVFQGLDNEVFTNQDSSEVSVYMHEIISSLGLSDSTTTVLLLIAAVFVFKGLVMFVALSYDAYLRRQLIKELRQRLYGLYSNMDYRYYLEKDTGHFINIINTNYTNNRPITRLN